MLFYPTKEVMFMSDSIPPTMPVLPVSGAGYQLNIDTAAYPIAKLSLSSFGNQGQLKTATATGFSLSAILRQENIDLAALAGIGFVAGDGYIMVLPQELCLAKEIYICFSKNGRLLPAPMVAVEAARSMYWSYALTAIRLYPPAALPDGEAKRRDRDESADR